MLFKKKMPKRQEVPEVVDKPEEEYEGMDEEELEEEELRSLQKRKKELEQKLNKQPQVDKPNKSEKKQRVEIKQRYSAFAYPPRAGIIDVESQEVMAEGEFAVLQSLSWIMEKIERIEANLGSLMGD